MNDDNHISDPKSPDDVPISDLSYLYDEPDSRAYYQSLGALDYRTPEHVQQLARWCFGHFCGGEPWILDVGCGFGVNGAGLLYGVAVQDLLTRYDSDHMRQMSPESVIELDMQYFSEHPRQPCHMAGLDVSRSSLDYGLRTGLLDVAFDDNLMQAPVPDDLIRIVASGALIIESGVPIFIAPHVIDALLAAAGSDSRPWVITAPPRYTNVSGYSDVFEKHGYVMEQVSPDPLPHRQFHSPEEADRIIDQQIAMGIDSTAEKQTGYIYTTLFLARPAGEANKPVDFSPVVRALVHP